MPKWLEKITQLFKVKELRNKIFFVLALLVIFRIVANIPVPGVDVSKLKDFFAGNQLFGLINIFTGGAMSHFSIAMLGLGPYITATIILQLLTMIFPKLKEMYHESGPEGRNKFNQYGRILTVPLAAMQAYAMITILRSQQIIGYMSPITLFTSISIITAGALFLMWLGELISEKGIGNGVSLLIFAGIIARIPSDIRQAIATYNPVQLPSYIGFLVVAILVIAGVVIINEGQRNVPIAYAKRVRGRRMYGGFSTHLPLRVNQAGVIPIIFALSIMLFPGMIAKFLANVPNQFIAHIATAVGNIFTNQLFYAVVYFVLVVVFTFFYTAVTFDPKAIAENIQKQGGFVPGIRPGENTATFFYRILNRITLAGALFLGVIAVLPMVISQATGVASLSIGGTAVLIVVSVVLETMKQVESQLVMRDYEGF
ncbi:MAG: preprotein translocase subunit SecY [Candidatus Portnoybacteria bacterium CG10_big_fil_rev_8_21_14_0_10_38_18]|uniref:Protein translocase subunit SecY n=1 Tax=Candidatus Portnoybacteria bacterium CG10_big_fil_rev_8_21_14_0_10_38_18 TaxID=1974813 RepID=A0A2M8KCD7_9BACT|nr:MAG: preprotein translocase subunit SecY [Candidatus Portnoybacteria bacterium CG10_big_fil_rev_8_21_14_0_10_38_18]